MNEPVLNVVQRPQFPCPSCGSRRPMRVYVDRVRRDCGHTTSLPPIVSNGHRLKEAR